MAKFAGFRNFNLYRLIACCAPEWISWMICLSVIFFLLSCSFSMIEWISCIGLGSLINSNHLYNFYKFDFSISIIKDDIEFMKDVYSAKDKGSGIFFRDKAFDFELDVIKLYLNFCDIAVNTSPFYADRGGSFARV